ncbi:Transcription factor MYB3R-3 [Glycine soja]|uniref:Transcription factor MYB3R-3 n=1 Tax=Glycine soja TaxID=3848 RepID=A0A445FUI3_GLYSO|nr:Transcription factor MYB3R-3 [Glycine soja]
MPTSDNLTEATWTTFVQAQELNKLDRPATLTPIESCHRSTNVKPLAVGLSTDRILGSCMKDMAEVVKSEECCQENKQSTAASCSSVSEGSGSAIHKSPAICSPASTSPSHRRTTGPIRRAKGGWTAQEDETLRNAVAVFKGKSWKKIGWIEFSCGAGAAQPLGDDMLELHRSFLSGRIPNKTDLTNLGLSFLLS